jgi:hypothetical protein
LTSHRTFTESAPARCSRVPHLPPLPFGGFVPLRIKVFSPFSPLEVHLRKTSDLPSLPVARLHKMMTAADQCSRFAMSREVRCFLERVCRAYSRPDVAYRLLQQHDNVRATKPGFPTLAGTEASTSFLFLRDTPSPLRERCRAASRATFIRFGPGAGSSCSRRLARPRYRLGCPTSELLARSIVRINVHGSKDRVKDASPRRGRRLLVPVAGCLRVVDVG